MGSLFIAPDIVEAHYAWFGVSLVFSTLFAALWSPKRRRVIGSVRYLAAWQVIAAPALFGVIAVRGGYALAYQETGMHPLLAQLLGSVWGFGFILIVRLGLMLFPPSAWLLREWRRANREASFLNRAQRAKDKSRA